MTTSLIRGVFLITVLAFSSMGYAQQDTLVNEVVELNALSLEESATKMITSIVEKDYDTYLDMTYPVMIEVFGGEEMMKKSTKSNKEAQETAGMVLKSARLANISDVLEKKGEFQAIVSFEYILEISGKDYKGEQYLLALANKEDLNWTFVELETFDEASIIEFLPNYNQDLIFPTIKGAEYFEK